MVERLNASDLASTCIQRIGGVIDIVKITGQYDIECIGKDGKAKWKDQIKNLVTTVAKNLILDTVHSGASYSVTGPYMGLISSVGYTGVDSADTMSSHAGWNEAGSGVNYPLYNGTRKTCVFSAASGGFKALSAALEFTIETTGGTVKGCFIVLGTGAEATIGSTAGILYSAGAFTGGDKVVDVGDILKVSYTAGM